MLPRAPEGAGYYVYGNVGGRPHTGHLAQYAHPSLMTLILCIEREWQAIDDRKFGIGNISIDGGVEYDGHATHKKGIEVDIRPVRKDKLTGQAARVTRFDDVYDREATTRLTRLFAWHLTVRVIYLMMRRYRDLSAAGGCAMQCCMMIISTSNCGGGHEKPYDVC